MDPVAIDLGFFGIRWYSLLLILAFIVGYFIIKKIGRERGIKVEIIERYSVWFLISAIVGARLFEVLFYSPAYYFADPIKIFYVWQGGIASHGAILGVAIMTYFFAKKNKLRFYQLSDLAVIPSAFGAVFVRIGNFINGELVGKVTDSFLGIKFDNYEGLRHPIQLYHATSNLVLFGILYSLRKFKEGIVTWSFVGLFSLFRFVLEFWKDMPSDYGFVLLNLNLAQWLSLVGIGLSLFFLVKLRKLH